MLRHCIKKVLRYIYLKYTYGKYLHFSFSVNIFGDLIFEGANSISDRSTYSGHMGYGSYIGTDSEIIGNVGRFSSIAPEVKCNLGVHPMKKPFATTSPMFFSLLKQSGTTFAKKQMFNEFKKPITIGNDCWVGQRVFIIGDVSIGDGAIVLAGAVVTKDVPAYAIVGGVPAKIINYRYDDETIQFLLQTKWWNMPIKWLNSNYELLCDIDKLKMKLIEYKNIV